MGDTPNLLNKTKETEVRSMGNLLRGSRGILIILAVIVVIVLVLVLRGFVIGDADNDEDQGSTGSSGVSAQVV